MSVSNFKELRGHVGHELECVHYAEQNTAIECIDCGEVLLSFDKDDEIKQDAKDRLLVNVILGLKASLELNKLLCGLNEVKRSASPKTIGAFNDAIEKFESLLSLTESEKK